MGKKAKIEQDGREVKELRYYFYTSFRHPKTEKEIKKPVVTVVLLSLGDGVFYRGISICGDNDIPNKKLGHDIARGRACKAFEMRRLLDRHISSHHVIRDEAHIAMIGIHDTTFQDVIAKGKISSCFADGLFSWERVLWEKAHGSHD